MSKLGTQFQGLNVQEVVRKEAGRKPKTPIRGCSNLSVGAVLRLKNMKIGLAYHKPFFQRKVPATWKSHDSGARGNYINMLCPLHLPYAWHQLSRPTQNHLPRFWLPSYLDRTSEKKERKKTRRDDCGVIPLPRPAYRPSHARYQPWLSLTTPNSSLCRVSTRVPSSWPLVPVPTLCAASRRLLVRLPFTMVHPARVDGMQAMPRPVTQHTTQLAMLPSATPPFIHLLSHQHR